MKEHEIDRFKLIGRIAIVVPVVIVALAIYFRYTDTRKQQLPIVTNPVIKAPSGGEALQKNPAPPVSGSTIDLEGPSVCRFTLEQGEDVEAYIKNKNVYASYTNKNDTSIFLLNGDCLYTWKQGSFQGEKMCGISQYIGLVETLMSTSLLDMGTVISSLPGQSISRVPKNVPDLSKVCKKEEVEDNIFIVPQNVYFKETEATGFPPSRE